MTRFCNNLHQVRSKSKRLESQIIQKNFGTRKPKDINRTAKVGLDQIRLREENFSFNNTKMYLHFLQY